MIIERKTFMNHILCLVIALSDCIIVSSYSDGELLLTRIHMSFSFLHLFMAQHPSLKSHFIILFSLHDCFTVLSRHQLFYLSH